MESLSYILSKVAVNGKLNGLQVTNRSLVMAHLFFADDIILFGKVRDAKAYELVKILNLFSLTSDQRINTLKSGLVFGKRVSKAQRDQFSCILSIPEWENPRKYLGLSGSMWKSKKSSLSWIRDAI